MKHAVGLLFAFHVLSAAHVFAAERPNPGVIAEVCRSLTTVIRISVDKFVGRRSAGQAQQDRLLVALEAHERLNCNPLDLVDALRLTIPGIDLQKYIDQ